MELLDTTQLMSSPDYKDRFKGEYYQLKIRAEKLKAIVDNYDNLGFTPTCPRTVLLAQYSSMTCYLHILEYRAELEGVPLDE